MLDAKAKPVPSEVAIAVWTGRKEFLALLRARLARGEKLPDDQIDGLVTLCEEFVLSHFRDQERCARFGDVVGDMAGLFKAYGTLSRKALAIVESMKKDLHDEEDRAVIPSHLITQDEE